MALHDHAELPGAPNFVASRLLNSPAPTPSICLESKVFLLNSADCIKDSTRKAVNPSHRQHIYHPPIPNKTREKTDNIRRMLEAQSVVEDALNAGVKTWIAGTISFQTLTPWANTPKGARKVLTQLHKEILVWLQRRGLLLARVTGLEHSKVEGIHAHFLIAVPQPHAKALRTYIKARLQALTGAKKMPKGAPWWGGRHHTIHRPAQARGELVYCLKHRVPTGERICGVDGPDPKDHGGMLPIRGQTLFYKFSEAPQIQ